MPPQIRAMCPSDAQAVAVLLPELGYQASASQVQERFSLLVARPENGLFVAEIATAVVGWAHVYGVRLIASEGYAEIGGLVVSARHQRQGIGAQLVHACERWAANTSYGRVRLRSGVHREPAHQFYESLGYARSRSSYAFERLVAISTTA